jgi:hypothetical protein
VGSSRRRAVLAPGGEEALAAAAPAPSEATEPEPGPSPLVAPGIEQAPVKVTVKIDSDPEGAEITGDGGKLLGVTPTVLAVIRSTRPLSFEVSKAGYAPARQTVVPDREVSAVLTLRPEDDPARKRAGHRRKPGPAAGEGRVREGLSVDPFADEKKAHK